MERLGGRFGDLMAMVAQNRRGIIETHQLASTASGQLHGMAREHSGLGATI